ncbi:hypothetical protein ACJMK2_017183 [Sinanodonta woodiana]|uniref:VWFA domain-containing protein n=1 Tax=Sinanodonta woodiana TaxID=1069815 RepID=A0ABD3UZG0_SINWO
MGYDEIRKMFNAFIEQNSLERVDGFEEFKRIFQEIQLRYGGIDQALRDLKDVLESRKGNGTLIKDTLCCALNPDQLSYGARFRGKVDMNNACFGNNSNLLDSMANFQNHPDVTWQYYADCSGQFLQYPGSNRQCDAAQISKTAGPLVEEWFVEKLHMEMKNIVVVYDNGGMTKERRAAMTEAVSKTLKTLTHLDKVNLVVFPVNNSTRSASPESCRDRLFIANQKNIEYLQRFVQSTQGASGTADIFQALELAYSMLLKERQQHLTRYDQGKSMVILLIDRQKDLPASRPKHDSIVNLVARYEQQLNRSLLHFIYVLETSRPSQNFSSVTLSELQMILQAPQGPDRKGSLMVYTDLDVFTEQVPHYFRRLPPRIDKEKTMITPLVDQKLGLFVTLATPVYNATKNGVIGFAAVQATLASVFSGIVSFDYGVHSYAYLIETRHGHVLLHPKLRDPDITKNEDSLFPPLEIVEPDLSEDQRQKLLTPGILSRKFNATLRQGRSSFSSEMKEILPPQPAIVYYQRLIETNMCIVMVYFDADSEQIIPIKLMDNDLHASYHRVDLLIDTPLENKLQKDFVCQLDGRLVAYNESVIKLSPGVFKNPELYKYTPEDFHQAAILTKFLLANVPTTLIRDGKFFGTSTGFLRIFPGVQMSNSFNHVDSKWFKKSVSRSGDLVVHRDQLCEVHKKEVIILSKAITSRLQNTDKLQGVLGATMSLRHFTGNLFNIVTGCYSNDFQCHLLDDSGYFLDIVTTSSSVVDRHITVIYPWLADRLVNNNHLQQDWCTEISDGYHKLIYTISGDISDISSLEPCHHFSLQRIPATNMYLLVLMNRTTSSCSDTDSAQMCASCQVPSPDLTQPANLPQCKFCLYAAQSHCQCPCYCDSDFDQCDSQYKQRSPGATFPYTSCYDSPCHETDPLLLPSVPKPSIPPCNIPCATVDDLVFCTSLQHCKVSYDQFPVCIWRNQSEIDQISTKPLLTPPQRALSGGTDVPTPPKPVMVPSKDKTEPGIHTLPRPTNEPPEGTTSRTDIPTPPGSTSGTLVSSPHKPTNDLSKDSTTGPLFPTPPIPSSEPPSDTTTTLPEPKGSTSRSPLLDPHGSTPHSIAQPGATELTASTATTLKNVPIERKEEAEDHRTGLIVGVVIACCAVVLILAFILVKLYRKKFHQAETDNTGGKYLTGSTIFDSTLFNRSTERVTLGMAPTSTVPYEPMWK